MKALKTRPSNEVLLDLYGLFKQAASGDNTSSQPWAIQVEARAKWDAWTARKGMSSEEAKTAYIALANKLIAEDK